MIPILFDSNATVFTTNGIGRLADTISCEVTEERNGAYELELVYPMAGRFFGELTASRIIYAKASNAAGPQAFRIYKISRPMSGRVSVFARHISYQLNFIPFEPFTASTLATALTGLMSHALETCPFTLTADFTSTKSFATVLPASIRSYLGGRRGSIIDVYGNGAEWEWNNYTCTLHQHRGADRGVVLRYGKNITDINQEQNIENTITGILPYWTSEEAHVVLNAPVESPTAANYPYPRTIVKDCSSEFDNAPTAAQLQAWAEQYVASAGIGIPKVSIDVNFIALADTLEYKDLAPLETINLCDTITVRFERLGIDTKAKIIKLRYDTLKERTISFAVGDSRTNLVTTIDEQIEAVEARPTAEAVGRSIDKATGVLNSGTRGHVIMMRNQEGWANELYFVDNENIYSAVKALRINQAGIGFSSTGINGPYLQSWTLDGRLTLGGVNNGYGDLLILDENGIPTIQVDKDGLKLWGIEGAGYLYNGVMYVDPEHQTAITPTMGKYYFDLVEYVVYSYGVGGYTAVTDNEGLLAKMTHDGLGLYEGDIDLQWNGQTGIKFAAGEGGASDELMIGDFMVSNQENNGRQIFESSDEMTGMSGEPQTGQYFLWAGWRSGSDFALAVENQGGGGADNVIINGNLYVNGIDVMSTMMNMSVEDDHESTPSEYFDGVTIDLDLTQAPT